MRGMIIECGGCGYFKAFNLGKKPEEIESQVNDAIQSGWRYVQKWDDFICPKCAAKYRDKSYQSFCTVAVGRPRTSSKINSYKALMLRACRQIREFQEIDRLCGG